MREANWFTRGSGTLTSREQLARRVDWLIATLADEAPELVVHRREWNEIGLVFDAPAPAERFHAAVLAENMFAELDGAVVLLRVTPWYTTADVESIALAVAKVAHYLRG